MLESASIPYIRKPFILERLALVPYPLPHYARLDFGDCLADQPIRSPKYMNSEKVWAGIPEYSSVGLSSASWIEGNRAEKSRHAYKGDGLHSAQKHTERQDRLHVFIPIVAKAISSPPRIQPSWCSPADKATLMYDD